MSWYIDQLCFAYVNTDIQLKNHYLENTIDNRTQNEHQIRLPMPDNESELQNEPPVSFSHLYTQSSIVPEISNSSEPQSLQLCQAQDNTDKCSANINKSNPDSALCRSQRIRNSLAYLKDYTQ